MVMEGEKISKMLENFVFIITTSANKHEEQCKFELFFWLQNTGLKTAWEKNSFIASEKPK